MDLYNSCTFLYLLKLNAFIYRCKFLPVTLRHSAFSSSKTSSFSLYVKSRESCESLLFFLSAALPDVIHAVAKYEVAHEPREIFFFREGSIVMWNISDLESGNLLQFLRRYELNRYTEEVVHSESELMNYVYAEAGYLSRFLSIYQSLSCTPTFIRVSNIVISDTLRQEKEPFKRRRYCTGAGSGQFRQVHLLQRHGAVRQIRYMGSVAESLRRLDRIRNGGSEGRQEASDDATGGAEEAR